jgi:hypothetical protein
LQDTIDYLSRIQEISIQLIKENQDLKKELLLLNPAFKFTSAVSEPIPIPTGDQKSKKRKTSAAPNSVRSKDFMDGSRAVFV